MSEIKFHAVLKDIKINAKDGGSGYIKFDTSADAVRQLAEMSKMTEVPLAITAVRMDNPETKSLLELFVSVAQ